MFHKVYHSRITTAAVCTDSPYTIIEVPPPPKKKGTQRAHLENFAKKKKALTKLAFVSLHLFHKNSSHWFLSQSDGSSPHRCTVFL